MVLVTIVIKNVIHHNKAPERFFALFEGVLQIVKR